jgi:L-2-hydroxyglutarate oxidase
VTDPARSDVLVVGAGIVGLATAHAILRSRPGTRVVVLDKEDGIARHQTGRNSGVIHSGVYYRPDSLKARFAADGARAMVTFCREQGIAHEVCGKVIVAVDADEAARLDTLEQLAQRNGVRAVRIGPERLRELEPHVTGVGGLHVQDTGIVDFVAVAERLGELVRDAGGTVELGEEVVDVLEGDGDVVVETSAGSRTAACVVNCAGLQSDLIARRVLGDRPDVRIVPFRGEYHELVPSRRFLVRSLIYPVPDPDLPFLGVHLTRDVHGGVHVGPNAVLALAREAYTWKTISPREITQLARYPGFRRLARHYWRLGATEINRSVRRRALVKALRRLVPEVRRRDLVRAPAGIRAQALSRDGRLLDDFEIRESARAVHVLNAPSPAATASLLIGDHIAAKVVGRLG